MHIDSFESLLVAAAVQSQPQQLLLTFTAAEAQPGSHGLGAPRTLVPVMCVSKQVGELDTFNNLAEEAGKMGAHWDVVLVTTLSGSGGRLPDAKRTDEAQQAAIAAIRAGQLERFLAFDRDGGILQFH